MTPHKRPRVDASMHRRSRLIALPGEQTLKQGRGVAKLAPLRRTAGGSRRLRKSREGPPLGRAGSAHQKSQQ